MIYTALWKRLNSIGKVLAHAPSIGGIFFIHPAKRILDRMKDYYGILGCTPMSSREEIKRQYRRLAQQYHPDKNQDDKLAQAKFHDIKEAYETLSQPAKKEAWLQERWLRQVYNQSTGEKEPVSPYSILDKVLKLDRFVASQDAFRMDQGAIVERILGLLSDENVQCLLDFRENEINRTIVQYLLSATAPVDHQRLKKIWPRLEKIAAADSSLLNMLHNYRQLKKRQRKKERWTLPLVLVFTLLLCVLIWWMSN